MTTAQILVLIIYTPVILLGCCILAIMGFCLYVDDFRPTISRWKSERERNKQTRRKRNANKRLRN